MSKKEEVTGQRRVLHNEKLHDSKCSPKIFEWLKQGRKFGGICVTLGK